MADVKPPFCAFQGNAFQSNAFQVCIAVIFAQLGRIWGPLADKKK